MTGTAAAGGAARPPWLIRVGQQIIPRLPAGRSRAARWLADRAHDPFVAKLSADHGGALFWCDLHDAICRDACLLGHYEPQVSRVAALLMPACSVVLDVGANWGYFTLMAAALMPASGRVLAFEPDPRMHALLRRNVQLNGGQGVEALPVAAGAAAGTVTLAGYDEAAENRGVSRISADASGGEATFSVAAVTVDAVLQARAIEFADLVKVDVEGAEDMVLAGMEKTIRGRRLRRLLIELHPELLARRGLTADDCCEPLRQAGYHGWTFDHSPAAVRRASYTRALEPRELLQRADRVPAADPWPHMLWLAPGVELP